MHEIKNKERFRQTANKASRSQRSDNPQDDQQADHFKVAGMLVFAFAAAVSNAFLSFSFLSF